MIVHVMPDLSLPQHARVQFCAPSKRGRGQADRALLRWALVVALLLVGSALSEQAAQAQARTGAAARSAPSASADSTSASGRVVRRAPRLGLVFDDESYEQVPVAPSLMRGGGDEMPTVVSLRSYAPKPGSQGTTGTCVAWATAYGARTISAAISRGWTDRDSITARAFSPSFVYNQIRSRPGCSHGTAIDEALSLLKSQGVVSISQAPFDCDLQVDEQMVASAEPNVILDYRRLFSVAETERVGPVRDALAARRPVVIGMRVPPSFGQLKGEVWQPLESERGKGGGHAMTVVGYDDDRYGGAFEIMNSWGTWWADDGFVWVPYSAFNDFVKYAFEVLPVPSAPSLGGRVELIDEYQMPMLLAPFEPAQGGGAVQSFVSQNAYGSDDAFSVMLTNDEAAYVYAIGTDLSRETTLLFPYEGAGVTSAYVPDPGSRVSLPGEGYQMGFDDRPGTTSLVLLYSTRELDIDSVRVVMETGEGGVEQRLAAALGDALVPPQRIDYDADKGEVGYSARGDGAGYVVPVVVHIEHRATFASADLVPPQVTLLDPTPAPRMRGLEVRKRSRSDTLVVRGTALDEGGVAEVRVNGTPARFEEGGVFVARLPGAGVRSLFVTAVDSAGNTSEYAFDDVLASPDTTGPLLTVSTSGIQEGAAAPGSAASTQTQIVLRGIAADPSGVRAVYANGLRAELSATGAFQITVDLSESQGTLVVRAADGEGNVTMQTYYSSR